jgi:hypothetical protein
MRKAILIAATLLIASPAYAVDTALIRGGSVVQIWRNTRIADAKGDNTGELREFADNLAIVGQLWNGSALSNPPPSVVDPGDKTLRPISRKTFAQIMQGCSTLVCIRDAVIALRDSDTE